MAKPKTQDHYVKTALRLPPELHAQLHDATEASGRSLNAEIVARLEASFGQEDVTQTAKMLSVRFGAEMNEQFRRFEEMLNVAAVRFQDLKLGPPLPSEDDED